jgi:hypothetical protein
MVFSFLYLALRALLGAWFVAAADSVCKRAAGAAKARDSPPSGAAEAGRADRALLAAFACHLPRSSFGVLLVTRRLSTPPQGVVSMGDERLTHNGHIEAAFRARVVLSLGPAALPLLRRGIGARARSPNSCGSDPSRHRRWEIGDLGAEPLGERNGCAPRELLSRSLGATRGELEADRAAAPVAVYTGSSPTEARIAARSSRAARPECPRDRPRALREPRWS